MRGLGNCRIEEWTSLLPFIYNINIFIPLNQLDIWPCFIMITPRFVKLSAWSASQVRARRKQRVAIFTSPIFYNIICLFGFWSIESRTTMNEPMQSVRCCTKHQQRFPSPSLDEPALKELIRTKSRGGRVSSQGWKSKELYLTNACNGDIEMLWVEAAEADVHEEFRSSNSHLHYATENEIFSRCAFYLLFLHI